MPILAAVSAACGPPLAAAVQPSDVEGEVCNIMQTSLLQTGVAVAPRILKATRSDSAAASADATASFVAAAGQQPRSNTFGPYLAHSERVYVGGYHGCGYTNAAGDRVVHQDAEVWYPVAAEGEAEPGPVPVISFSHGLVLGGDGVGGVGVGVSHGTIVPYLTSWGYVVILHTSEAYEFIWRHPANPIRRRRSVSSLEVHDNGRGDSVRNREEDADRQPRRHLPRGIPPPLAPVHCAHATSDQIHSLEWIRGSEFASRIDWDLPVGVAGFSQGGTATVQTLMNAAAVARHNIGAGVAFMPFEIAASDSRSPLAPVLLASGELDTLSGPEEIREFYDAITTDVPRAHAMVAGLGHNDALRDEPFHRFAVAMFRCHLNGRSDSCALVYSDAPESLCRSSLFPVCEHANGPPS